jgi:hypothetical protein
MADLGELLVGLNLKDADQAFVKTKLGELAEDMADFKGLGREDIQELCASIDSAPNMVKGKKNRVKDAIWLGWDPTSPEATGVGPTPESPSMPPVAPSSPAACAQAEGREMDTECRLLSFGKSAMEELETRLKQEGESADAISLLKTLDYSSAPAISSAIGKATRDIVLSLVPGDVDIEKDYWPPFATSYASDRREGDAEGQGPGVVRNYQVSTAFVERGQMLPMNGMLFRRGNFLKGYLKCLNFRNMATELGKPAAKVLVVLLSNALIRSAACLVEIHTALENNIPLVLLPLEDEIHWKATEGFSAPWPKEKCQPYLASFLKDWDENTFALNKGTVLAQIENENTYPPPGSVALEWAKNGGKGVLDSVVQEAVRKAGLSENKPLATKEAVSAMHNTV